MIPASPCLIIIYKAPPSTVKGKSKDISTVQDFQALDEVQEIGFVYIVDRQSSQSSSGYHMVYPS
jgi:hypothetical protein